jgi:sirohydrochlorin ferrochelatase
MPIYDRAAAPTEDVAVVLAAHGDRAGPAPNTTLLSHRDALRASGAFRHVAAGVLKGEPMLETALAEAAQSGAAQTFIYPLFMADGYFTKTVLPQRIASAGYGSHCTLLTPLGLDPRLPDLMLDQAAATAKSAQVSPASARRLVVGHGSKFGPASAEATRRVAEDLRRAGSFSHVETAFLEEPPFLLEKLCDNAVPTIVTGFFSGEGLHAGEDVPAAILESGANAHYAGPVGSSAGIARLVRTSIAVAISSQ